MLKIRSQYILKRIFQNTAKKPYLGLIKYNKKLQNKLGITNEDYKKYNQIIIELILNDHIKTNNNIFINLENKNKYFFHIFFGDSDVETERNYIDSDDKISKIKIIIDIEIDSLDKLFKNCKCIKEINFKQFNRKNIYDVSEIFCDCECLFNINFEKFKTDNINILIDYQDYENFWDTYEDYRNRIIKN